MTVEKYRHPFLFYGMSILIPWTLWFISAWLSHITPVTQFNNVLGSIISIIGLFSPMIVAFILMYRNPVLKSDLTGRIFNFRNIRPVYLVMTCLLMLSSILLAMAISLLFGHSAAQFSLAAGFSFTAGIFPAWFMLFIAPLIEELAWHSYGTDCLRNRFSLFTVSMLFALFWGFWHFPLSFIKGYYQANLAESGWIYSMNFVLSLFPYVLLMNWLYYKTGRNILIAIIFHITAGFFNELFATHPDSKVIQTVLLIIFAVIIIVKDKDFFFNKELPDLLSSEENLRHD